MPMSRVDPEMLQTLRRVGMETRIDPILQAVQFFEQHLIDLLLMTSAWAPDPNQGVAQPTPYGPDRA